MKSKQLRINIQSHHTSYIEQIANEMECSPNEALNHLLWVLKQQNYHFGNAPISSCQSNQYYNPSTFETQATVMSGLSWQPQSPQAIQDFEEIAQEVDPVIERLAGLLVDQF